MAPTKPRTASAPDPSSPIYFDANPLSDKHLTGIGRYTARLALAMRSMREIRFFAGNQVITPPAEMSWEQDQDLNRWANLLWQGEKSPLAAIPAGSVGIWPMLRPIERTFDHEVTILHDLTPLLLPHTHTGGTRSHFQGLCAKAIVSSDIALAVSHSTKADAEWLANIEADRIVVAHSGPSLCVAKHEHTEPVKRLPNTGLIVSTLEPRKNPEFFCDWFHSSPVLTDDAELLWVGSIGWITSQDDLKQFETRPGTNRRIKFLGIVSDAELCRLYQAAGYTAYPSLYEGFGFPVLDSLRHNTPVMAAMHSSIREFDSPGMFFFDPMEKSTLDDAYLQCRREGVGRSIPQAPLERAYSWSNVARILLEACESKKKLATSTAASYAA